MATIDPTLREVLRSRLGREPTHKEMCDAAVGGMPTRLGWEHFDYANILSEARMRLTAAHRSTAEGITAEMRTLEYWTAHVAHANAVAVGCGRMMVPAEMTAAVEAALVAERKVCADIARNGYLVPPDGGAPTESERLMCDAIAAAILVRD